MKHINYSNRLICIALWVMISLSACSESDAPAVPEPEEESMEQVDDLIYQFMREENVPGATLAVAYNGRLVYARGYGFADAQQGERMEVTTRSRISSISKTVTAITILKLIEEGKLSLDDQIFGSDGVLGDDFGSLRPYRPHIEELTIKHCLSHHVGGWGNASNDPTMMRDELDAAQLISYIIDNVPLSAAPGTSYAYSNVGFMILGRVIEKISGLPYEQYVQQAILKPVGIQTMEIGGNTLADRKPNEAKYDSPSAYTRNFERRDANGGWIATASDLVRLFVHIDGGSNPEDILSSSSLQTMTTPPFDYPSYGLGIYVKGSTWYHGGSFNGSRSHWIRNGSGFVAAIMVNGNASGISTLLEDVLKAPVKWPDQDLFKP